MLLEPETFMGLISTKIQIKIRAVDLTRILQQQENQEICIRAKQLD
jgi:hypothetical protein